MKPPRVEAYARTLPEQTTRSVRKATAAVTLARMTALPLAFEDVDAARAQAAAVKDYVLDNLGSLLEQLEANCRRNGVQVHWAQHAAAANKVIADICRAEAPDGAVVVKAKSMATEEIHLNHSLEALGYEVVETDLGEFVVQIDHDTPSHIVAPIIHKSKLEVAKSFEREGLGPYTEVPEELAMQARSRLRAKFREASVGISGVNFAVAETGRIVLLENEGNNRLSTTAPDVHIAVMGIEKVLPREADLPLFLRLLAGSSTGQMLGSYVHLISGPRRDDEMDGPRRVHLVLLDNGRTQVVNGRYRSILRCIRCGACQNVCPVYREASGHAYGHVYGGPIGAVLAPALEGVAVLGELAKASTLCGACQEACPVQIPIPKMLLELRDEAYRAGVIKEPIPWGAFAKLAENDRRWRMALKLVPLAGSFPHPLKRGWTGSRDLPAREGRDFRRWWRDRP